MYMAHTDEITTEIGHHGEDWGGWYGLVVMITFVAATALVVMYLARRPADRSSPNGSPESAGDILKRRLASGEISKKQYTELRKAINE